MHAEVDVLQHALSVELDRHVVEADDDSSVLTGQFAVPSSARPKAFALNSINFS